MSRVTDLKGLVVLAVTRFRVPQPEAEAFREDLRTVMEVLMRQQGCDRAFVGRAVDDPELWSLVSRWDGVGAYRRAISSYDVKLNAVALLSRSLDEPGAYEILHEAARAT